MLDACPHAVAVLVVHAVAIALVPAVEHDGIPVGGASRRKNRLTCLRNRFALAADELVIGRLVNALRFFLR